MTAHSSIEKFGAFLRKTRTEHSVSARELAELLGVTQATIYKWERGEQVPVQSNYDELCRLIPSLRNGPLPPCQNITKPRGAEGFTFPTPEAPQSPARPRPAHPSGTVSIPRTHHSAVLAASHRYASALVHRERLRQALDTVAQEVERRHRDLQLAAAHAARARLRK